MKTAMIVLTHLEWIEFHRHTDIRVEAHYWNFNGFNLCIDEYNLSKAMYFIPKELTDLRDKLQHYGHLNFNWDWRWY